MYITDVKARKSFKCGEGKAGTTRFRRQLAKVFLGGVSYDF